MMVFFIGFALMMNLQAVLPAHVVAGPNFPKLVAGLFLAPVIPAQVWKTRRLKNLALAGILTALLVYGVSSVIMVLNFDQIYYGDPWWGRTL